jgi:DNA-binding NarL/FixJ family response regulator
LFTDVVMPGSVKATELARRAKKLFPRIAVLFTSGYTEAAALDERAFDATAQLLGKPYRRDDLARKIRAVLAAATGQARTDGAAEPKVHAPDDAPPSAPRPVHAPVMPPQNLTQDLSRDRADR